jgi:hypothetical protein
VDTGFLDLFHDAAQIQLVAVVERVDVDLHRVFEEPVDQHGMVGRDVLGPRDEGQQRGLVVGDLHAAPAEHVGGSDQHRVADPVGDQCGLVER